MQKLRYNGVRWRSFISLALFGPCVLLVGCTKTEDVPSYLEIPVFGMTTEPAQGASSSKITEAWVTVDGKFTGVWELPARLPALTNGDVAIEVVPAIRRNGVFEDRLRYPFYTTWIGTATLAPNTTTTISPTTAYRSNMNFWLEPFDAAGTLLSTVNAEDTLVIFRQETHPELLRDGSPIGGVKLTTANPTARLITDQNFGLASGPVFLEMDYSTDVELEIGLLYQQGGFNSGEAYVTLVPTTSDGTTPVWNKAYIDISFVFNISSVTDRDIYFNLELPASKANGLVLLDNLKIVRFQ
ncbi:MAG: hypothetical protein MUE88_04760 [Flavobacteriales bacterium]|jgi:hypothetical protein|nr:hypothetical protein [Flavobacteriales bacterium]